MKKIIITILSLMIAASFGAGIASAESPTKEIAIYFLYTDNTEDKANPEVDAVSTATPYTNLEYSDIAAMTEMLVDEKDMDTYAIVVKEKYDANFDAMVDGAQEDIRNDRQFTFEHELPDLSEYTDIYLGAPVWWGTFPQPVKSFLENEDLDLSGKTIHFYSSHLGSRFGNMLEQLKTLWPDAELCSDPYTISASDSIKEQETDFKEWIKAQ